MAQFVECPTPDCGMPAEVIDRFTLGATDGPWELLRTLCVLGHATVVPPARRRPAASRPTFWPRSA